MEIEIEGVERDAVVGIGSGLLLLQIGLERRQQFRRALAGQCRVPPRSRAPS